MSMYVNFNELPITSEFLLNGIKFRKCSTRTARIIRPFEYFGQLFHFRRRELCVVGNYSVIDQEYYQYSS